MTGAMIELGNIGVTIYTFSKAAESLASSGMAAEFTDDAARMPGEFADDAARGAGELADDAANAANGASGSLDTVAAAADEYADDAARGAGEFADDAARAEPPAPEGAGDAINYNRPSGYRKGVRDKVWENAVEDDGVVRDPLTQEIINKDDPWQMGHKPGYEFRKHQQSAMNRGMSRGKFLDEHNNPDHYRPELPKSNQSHKGEDMTELYFGP